MNAAADNPSLVRPRPKRPVRWSRRDARPRRRADKSARRYAVISFTLPATLADEAAGVLIANGAMGCAVAGMTRPGARLKKLVRLHAYFERLPAAARVRIARAMAGAGMIERRRRVPRPRTIIDPGWATRWRSRFKPLRIGRRFVIAPPWRRIDARDADRLAITIRPAQAFGTGRHPSTRGVMLALETLLAPHGCSAMLDVGTGSGVLAIAALKLGARQVVALDNDPLALANARENAALSDGGAIRYSGTALARVRGRFDLITANIVSGTLVAMAPQLKRLLASGGRLVLAGILKRETRRVTRAYAPELRPIQRRALGGWATLVLARGRTGKPSR